MSLAGAFLVDKADLQLPRLQTPPQSSARTASHGTSRGGSRGGCSRRRAVRTSPPQCQRWWDIDVTAGGLFDTTALRPEDLVHKRPSTVPARPSQQQVPDLEFQAGLLATKALATSACSLLGTMQTLVNNESPDRDRGPSNKLQNGQGRLEQNMMQPLESSAAEDNTSAGPAGFALVPCTPSTKAPSIEQPRTARKLFSPTAWCGRCKVLPHCECRRVVPHVKKHISQKQSYLNVVKNQEMVPERLPHWPADPGDVHLPPTPGSVFSQRPHPCFPGLNLGDMARLDVQMLQFKVKAPSLIKILDEDCTDQSAMRLRLEADTVRVVMGKSSRCRSPDELKVVNSFLQRCKFFRDLPETLVKELVQYFILRTYDADTTIVRSAEKTRSILLILRGSVLKDERASSLMNSRYSAGFLLGCPDDPKVLDWKEPHVWEGLTHPCTVVADTTGAVDALSLSVDHLISALQVQSVKDRIDAMKLFVATKERPQAEFSKASRVFRNGQRVILHDLFSISTFPQKHRFFQEGTEASAKANIMMVISGEIHLKMKDVAVRTVTHGGVVGEEPLSGMHYQFTADCASTKARVLSISFADYVTHFLQGRLPDPVRRTSKARNNGMGPVCATAPLEYKPVGLTVAARTSSLFQRKRRSLHPTGAQARIADGHPFQNSLSRETLDALVESLAGPTRRHRDKCNLVEGDWQTMRNKRSMSIAPAGLDTRSDRKVDEMPVDGSLLVID